MGFQRGIIICTISTFIFLLASCSDTTVVDHGEEIQSATEMGLLSQQSDMKFEEGDAALLKAVKQATSRFHSTTQANRAGYLDSEHCVYSDDGGMGYHWVNQELVDPVFDPLMPEALLYEKDKNGNMKLIAVEYIVIDVGQPHPYFGDHPFDVGGTPVPVPHYSLHVWLYKDNPDGIFTPYNPTVSCYN